MDTCQSQGSGKVLEIKGFVRSGNGKPNAAKLKSEAGKEIETKTNKKQQRETLYANCKSERLKRGRYFLNEVCEENE